MANIVRENGTEFEIPHIASSRRPDNYGKARRKDTY